MPLKPRKGKAAISSNIKELIATGKYPQKQAIAIAMANARRTAGKKIGVKKSSAS